MEPICKDEDDVYFLQSWQSFPPFPLEKYERRTLQPHDFHFLVHCLDSLQKIELFFQNPQDYIERLTVKDGYTTLSVSYIHPSHLQTWSPFCLIVGPKKGKKIKAFHASSADLEWRENPERNKQLYQLRAIFRKSVNTLKSEKDQPSHNEIVLQREGLEVKGIIINEISTSSRKQTLPSKTIRDAKKSNLPIFFIEGRAGKLIFSPKYKN